MEETTEPVSFYQAVGGEQTFRRLVHSFYRRVAADPRSARSTRAGTSGRPRSTSGCS